MDVQGLSRKFSVLFLVSFLLVTLRCATTTVDTLPPLPEPPEYTKVPHPNGYDLRDIEVIFFSYDGVPERDLKDCDSSFQRLDTLTSSREEVEKGAEEMVSIDPVFYHWCFYRKILALNTYLKNEVSIKNQREETVRTFSFLSETAKAFRRVYSDSRYIRWAIHHYQTVSHRVFYTEMALTPEMERDLVQAKPSPFGLWRKPANSIDTSVMEKYGLKEKATEEVNSNSTPEPTPEVASAPLADEDIEENRSPAVTPESTADLSTAPTPTPVTNQAPTPVDVPPTNQQDQNSENN